MKTAKRSAASRKAWRTRKRMKAARSSRQLAAVCYREYMAERAAERKAARERHAEAFGNLVQAVDNRLTEIIEGRQHWPEYKRRALPLPEFGNANKPRGR